MLNILNLVTVYGDNMSLEDFDTDLEKAEYLQNIMIAMATGRACDGGHYKELRRLFLDNHNTRQLLPRFVRTNRNLEQFWQFIKAKSDNYAGRRELLWNEFQPLLEYLEPQTKSPAEKPITDKLQFFNQEKIYDAWSRALGRKDDDPEGAITAVRTLLESVCKYILDECGIEYKNNVELHQLYSMAAKELNLSPDQHNEKIFKQILGGCSGIVNGLGSLRNAFGDAHGKGKNFVKPAPRHAELAVNLAGTVAVFLMTTFEEKSNR